jgi:hypothetical protein
MHVDDDRAVAVRFVEFDDLGRLWTIESGYLYRAHRII